MIRRLHVLMMLVVIALPMRAVQPDEILDDPVLEAQAREISAELRCVVCTSESIDQSDAGVARDIRLIVREQLVAGQSREEILDFLVARYGEVVLLKPRFQGSGALLWLMGPLLLLFGLMIVFFIFKKGRQTGKTGLSDEEKAELERLRSE